MGREIKGLGLRIWVGGMEIENGNENWYEN